MIAVMLACHLSVMFFVFYLVLFLRVFSNIDYNYKTQPYWLLSYSSILIRFSNTLYILWLRSLIYTFTEFTSNYAI